MIWPLSGLAGRPVNASRTLLLAALASILTFSIYLINGAALFYYDTAGYLLQGQAVLEQLGWDDGSPEPQAAILTASPADQAAATDAGIEPPSEDISVVGSRSAAYGIAVALTWRLAGPSAMVLANFAAIWAATWLAARQIASGGGVRLAAWALIVASLGALPFYVAFLMPDILAPVLILCVATIGAWGKRLSWGELTLALGLAVVAILAHPTHLLLAATLCPVAFLLSPSLAGRRSWIAGGVLALLFVVGLAERVAFSAVVDKVERREVIYLPFLTARLVDDGPGFAVLERDCPDVSIPTCLLYTALAAKDDPLRLDAPMILFSRFPETSSFLELSSEERSAVSKDQLRFAWEVLRSDPLGVFGAVAANTVRQLLRIRIDMTLHEPGAAQGIRAGFGLATADLQDGRLTSLNRRFLDSLALAHAALYLASLGALIYLVLARRRSDLAAFAGTVLAGLLLNALICGAISEPADRYGARVMSLLPLAAALLAAASWRRGRVSSPVGAT